MEQINIEQLGNTVEGIIMVFKARVADKVRMYIKYQVDSVDKKEIADVVSYLASRFRISRRTVYRIIKEPFQQQRTAGLNRGPKNKLSLRTEKRLIRNISKIRKAKKNWSTHDLMNLTDVTEISTRTAQRILNRHGYHHLTARKKGEMSTEDYEKRARFAKCNTHKDITFWRNEIAFYFDGVGFQHKTNPYSTATSCGKKVWRKTEEGLHVDCTAKGSKVGYGGKQAKFFVAISYNHGVILAEQYEHLSGETFANFIRQHFQDVFRKSGKQSMTWLQDGDPSQNSKKSKDAQDSVGANLFPIPPRSPELNPIENVFAFVKKDLAMQAINNNIQQESYKQFCARVKATLLSTSTERIDNIIDSYGRRLAKIVLQKGGRINY